MNKQFKTIGVIGQSSPSKLTTNLKNIGMTDKSIKELSTIDKVLREMGANHTIVILEK